MENAIIEGELEAIVEIREHGYDDGFKELKDKNRIRKILNGRLNRALVRFTIHKDKYRVWLEKSNQWPLPDDCLLAKWFEFEPQVETKIFDCADSHINPKQIAVPEPLNGYISILPPRLNLEQKAKFKKLDGALCIDDIAKLRFPKDEELRNAYAFIIAEECLKGDLNYHHGVARHDVKWLCEHPGENSIVDWVPIYDKDVQRPISNPDTQIAKLKRFFANNHDAEEFKLLTWDYATGRRCFINADDFKQWLVTKMDYPIKDDCLLPNWFESVEISDAYVRENWPKSIPQTEALADDGEVNQNSKRSLIKKEYYRLTEAADILGCTVDDLIHLASHDRVLISLIPYEMFGKKSNSEITLVPTDRQTWVTIEKNEKDVFLSSETFDRLTEKRPDIIESFGDIHGVQVIDGIPIVERGTFLKAQLPLEQYVITQIELEKLQKNIQSDFDESKHSISISENLADDSATTNKPRKKLKPRERDTTEGLLLVYEIFATYKVEYLDNLPISQAWGKIISGEFKSDLIKEVSETKKFIVLHGGEKLYRTDFSDKYRRRFE